MKDNKSKWGIDVEKFNEKGDWFKRLSITFRNTSDKPVYGVRAYLFFKPAGYPMSFSVQLTSRDLWRDPLAPRDEIEIMVNQGALNQALADAKNRGTDVSQMAVSFSLDTVIFSDELQWYRGKMLHPDSATPRDSSNRHEIQRIETDRSIRQSVPLSHETKKHSRRAA